MGEVTDEGKFVIADRDGPTGDQNFTTIGSTPNSAIRAYGEGADAVANGTYLKAAYAAAKALTPNGLALSSTNRACVLVYPGRYDLVASTGTIGITLDTEFVDLIGVGARESIWITSVGWTVAQTANDVVIKGLTLESVSASFGDVAYFPNTNLPLTKMEDVNCVGVNNAYSHRRLVEFSGTFTNCVATGGYGGYGAFGGGGTASGTFTNCVAGVDGFGGGGTASGTFTNCTAGDNGFGGGGGTASGTFTNCVAGAYGFGSFTGSGGIFSGTANNCTAGDKGFGGAGGTLSGQLYYCRLTSGNFETVSTGGITRLCIDGNNAENNQG